MSLFSKQKVYCNVCGREFETDFNRFGGRVCGSSCFGEMEWRRVLATMGKPYAPEPNGEWIDPRPRLIVLVGLPASGKSTFAKRFFEEAEYINLDTFKNRQAEMQAFHEALAQKKDIVIDNTNVTKQERARYIPLAVNGCGYRAWVYLFKPDVKGCIERNKARKGKARVPDVAIYSKNKKLEAPSLDEGFDSLGAVEIDPTGNAQGGFIIMGSDPRMEALEVEAEWQGGQKP